ncbi:MAG: UPF0175 family protein [Euryarchaeota archaeon]|nr:UPF0175 family protein [Euryarchaeota archaeon]
MAWAVDELKKLSEVKPELVEKTLKEISKIDPNFYKSLVIGAYIDGKISIGKAAELLGVTRVELQREFREMGIPVRIPSKEDAAAEVEALKAWKKRW